MMDERVIIPGSERKALPEHILGPRVNVPGQDTPINPKEIVEATVVTPGITAGTWSAINKFTHTYGLKIGDTLGAAVKISGAAEDIRKAFGVDLRRAIHANGEYRARVGPITIPKELDGIITAVLGLDNRPVAKPKYRKLSMLRANDMSPLASARPMFPSEAADAYNFPQCKGDGSTIFSGIISLGGGFRMQDMIDYAAKPRPWAPQGYQVLDIRSVSVDGAQNSPGDDADVENCLDICVKMDILVKKGATKAHIIIFFCPNSSMGFYDGFNAAAHWRDPATGKGLSECSISWGSYEDTYPLQLMAAMNSAALAGAANGVSYESASGDNGSSDGGPGDNVDCPANLTAVLGVGGTRLILSGTGSIGAETVWHNSDGGATGGGISKYIPTPSYQPGSLIRRGVPDLAGNADPVTGYVIQCNGQTMAIGGTSGSSPLVGAFICLLLNNLPTPPKFPLHQLFYDNADCFNDITQGSNGTFQAKPGYDNCTGIGTPNGTKLLAKLLGTVPPPTPIPIPPPPPVPTPPPIPTPTPVIGLPASLVAYDSANRPLATYNLAK